MQPYLLSASGTLHTLPQRARLYECRQLHERFVQSIGKCNGCEVWVVWIDVCVDARLENLCQFSQIEEIHQENVDCDSQLSSSQLQRPRDATHRQLGHQRTLNPPIYCCPYPTHCVCVVRFGVCRPLLCLYPRKARQWGFVLSCAHYFGPSPLPQSVVHRLKVGEPTSAHTCVACGRVNTRATHVHVY